VGAPDACSGQRAELRRLSEQYQAEKDTADLKFKGVPRS
jgi:hypothetical protein